MKTKTQKNAQKGFTLVELAIVLVIIGLIVGGVLAGQDLIKAAGLRNVQTQITQVNTAATAFQTKYNGIPGDLPFTAAKNAGFTALTGGASTLANVTVGLRDGNGLVDGVGATPAAPAGGGEVLAFWSDINIAGYFAGAPNTFSSALNTGVAGYAPAITTANANTYFPTTKLRSTALLFALDYLGSNYMFIGGAPAGGNMFTAANPSAPTIANAITPLEASAVDGKFDDGIPLSGTVMVPVAALTGLAAVPGVVASTTCLTAAAAPGAYNVATAGAATAGGNNLNCIIGIKASF